MVWSIYQRSLTSIVNLKVSKGTALYLRTLNKNGMIDRVNRTILEMVRCMLLATQMENIYCSEAIEQMSFI